MGRPWFRRNILLGPDGFLPTQLVNLAVWLRADKGITKDGGDAISQWDFENGTFRGQSNVAQAVGANQPTHVISDAAYNGQSTVSFDGGDYLDTSTFSSALSQPNSIFIVGEFSAIPTEMMIDSIVAGDRTIIYSGAGPENRLFAGANLNGGTTDANPHIYEGLFNSPNSELLVDGVSEATGDAGTDGMPSLRVGSDINAVANFLTGTIAEVIVYNALVSPVDRTLIRNYLSTRYSITV